MNNFILIIMVGSRFQFTCVFVKTSAKPRPGIAALASILFGQATCQDLTLTLKP